MLQNQELIEFYRTAILHPEYHPELFQRKLDDKRGTLEQFLLNALDEEGPRRFERIIIANPRIPKSSKVREFVLYNLAVEYGLDPSSATNYKESLQLEDLLILCVEAESYGLNPRIIFEKFDEINTYMKENKSKSIYRVGSDYTKSQMFLFVLDSLKTVKVYEAVNGMYAEAERVKNMTISEWEEYNNGIRWTQTGRVQELIHVAKLATEQFYSEINLLNAGSNVKGDALLEMMRNAPVVRDVADSYTPQGDLFSYMAFGFMINQKNMFDAIKIVPKQ